MGVEGESARPFSPCDWLLYLVHPDSGKQQKGALPTRLSSFAEHRDLGALGELD